MTILDANSAPQLVPAVPAVTLPPQEAKKEEEEEERDPPAFSLAVQRGSLLVLQEGMYTDYLHGIAERTRDVIDGGVANAAACGVRPGEVYERGTRVSLTFRLVPRTVPLRTLIGTGAR
jgi:hypothetical protein